MGEIVIRGTTPHSKTGTYTGNDTVNRAIPHGLGRTPCRVFFAQIGQNLMWDLNATGQINLVGLATLAVTAFDATNFYVGNAAGYGNSANAAGNDYRWTAV
jgi:hypothetical protein